MENQGTNPQSLVAVTADDDEYVVYSKTEIAHILRLVMQKNERVTAYFNRGSEFIVTTIVDVDAEEDELILDIGSNKALNEKIVESEKIIFVTAQDKIKIQFATDWIEKISYDQEDAFRTALPTTLLRVQRREFYRIATPIANPLKCIIPTGKGGKAEVTIADIGGGGIAISGDHPDLRFESGASYDNCRIDLPEIGTVTVTLQIRNVFEVPGRRGTKNKRAGCQFLNLSASAEKMIQRYIIYLERERRAKLVE